MFKNNVGVFTHQITNVTTQSTPFTLIVSVFVFPKLIARRLAVDDVLNTHIAQDLSLVITTDDTHWNPATVENILRGVSTNATRCSPDQHDIALLHGGTIATDQHAITRGVTQCIDGSFLPRQMRRLRHQLIGLDDTQISKSTKVGLISPNALIGRHH